MKRVVFAMIGILIALGLAFLLLSRPAVSPTTYPSGTPSES